jgi:hypothetical protein
LGLQEIVKIDFRLLTVEQSKLYNDIVPDLQETFNQVIGSIYHKNRNNYNWYFSSVASRNPHQSPLFERLCKVRLVEILLSQNDFLEVLVDDYTLYKFIIKNFRKDSLNISFIGKKKSKINILVILSFRYFKYLILILGKWFVSSFWKLNLIKDADLYLVDTFVYSGNNGQGTINNGFYNDRYFPGLLDYIKKTTDSDVYYLPTLLINKDFLPSFIKVLKQNNFLAKEPYLKALDWLSLVTLPLGEINLSKNCLKFKNYNIYDLVKDELLFNKFSISKLISGVNYNFIKRLSSRDINIKGFIEWYENQVNDRGMILGLRKYFTDVKVSAYQGFVICPNYNFYLAPTKYEDDHLLTPHQIAVTGNCLLKEPKKNYNIKTIVAPAFRFQHLYEPFEPAFIKNKIKILIPFSICLKSSLENLKMLFSAVEQSVNSVNFEIIVNLHPAVNSSDIRNSIQKKYQKILINDQNFYYNLKRCNLLVGSTSSACVEALVYGLNILIIGSRTGITSNPIPRKYIDKCKIVYSSNDLRKQIENFSNNTILSKENSIEALNDCFSKVDQDSVRSFITSTLNHK